ncbi:Ribosome-binding protein 1 [Babesia bigemina]|uniref:Ribosome-binding protein 1 n=1 Tax=Babesia bigemina TaxID=5866 RepID=A0A061D3F5_BABBI|nr:Ribosome-binding protein 1 [Babesia bigemina]CDR94612.1 Ribosome-binding protein 1 [Babesia bigemina]|eukprot:XP_012766798.1 Ribosome-binding protein 1 [Babesia bigemina]
MAAKRTSSVTEHGVKLETLKDCLQFLEWLRDTKRSGARTQLAGRLARLLNNKYNNVDRQRIEDALFQFLNEVSKFHHKLCKKADQGTHKPQTTKPALNALLECIPKVLAVMYYLRYHVDKGFAAMGGGDWADDMIGQVEMLARVMPSGSLMKHATNIEKYLITANGDKYGVIPGGFEPSDLKPNTGGGYSVGSAMAADLGNLLDKNRYKENLFLDVYSTTVVGNKGTDTPNIANALRLVRDFCRIFAEVEDEDDFKSHLYTKDKCIKYNQLKSHCAQLKDPLEKIFKGERFSFTGYGRLFKDLNKQNIAKKMASWFRTNLDDVLSKLTLIKSISSLKGINSRSFQKGKISSVEHAKALANYFNENFFRYGFTFYGHDFNKWSNTYEVLKTDWDGVIGVMKDKSEGLEELVQILNGEVCKLQDREETQKGKEQGTEDKNEDEKDEDEESEDEEDAPLDDKDSPPVKTEATKTEAAKPTAPKVDGTPNQGKKAEGAQNQGKKAEGDPPASSPSSKPTQPSSSTGSDSRSSGAGGPRSVQDLSVQRSPGATQTSGQEDETGKAASTRTPIGPSSDTGAGVKPNAGESTDHNSGKKSTTPQCEAGQTLTDSWKGGNKICISEERLKKAKYWESAWTKANEAKNEEEAEERKEKAAYEQYKLQMNQMTNYPLSLDGYDLKSPLDGAALPDDSTTQNRQKLDANFKIAYEKILQNQTRADDNMNNKIFQSEQRGEADEQAWIKREHNQDISFHGFKVKPSRHGSPIPTPSGLTGQVVSDASKNERSNHDDAVNQYGQQWKQSEERILSADGSHISPPLEGKALPDISDLLLHKQNEAEDKWAELNSGPFVQNAKYDEVFGNKFPKKKRTLHSQLTPFLTGNYVPDELRAYRLNENIEKAKDALKRIYARNEYQRRKSEFIGSPTADSQGIQKSRPLQFLAYNDIPMGYPIKPPKLPNTSSLVPDVVGLTVDAVPNDKFVRQPPLTGEPTVSPPKSTEHDPPIPTQLDPGFNNISIGGSEAIAQSVTTDYIQSALVDSDLSVFEPIKTTNLTAQHDHVVTKLPITVTLDDNITATMASVAGQPAASLDGKKATHYDYNKRQMDAEIHYENQKLQHQHGQRQRELQALNEESIKTIGEQEMLRTAAKIEADRIHTFKASKFDISHRVPPISLEITEPPTDDSDDFKDETFDQLDPVHDSQVYMDPYYNVTDDQFEITTVERSNDQSYNVDFTPADVSFDFAHNDVLATPTFTPLPPDTSLQITKPPKDDKAYIVNQDTYEAASQPLFIDIYKHTLDDPSYELNIDDPPLPPKLQPVDPIVPSTPAINLNIEPFDVAPISIPEDFDPQIINRPELKMCLAPWATQTSTPGSTDIPETELFPSQAPRTVRDMLQWLAGLKNEKHHKTLKQCIKKAFTGSHKDTSQLALSINHNNILPDHVLDILQLTAMFAGSVLTSIAPNWRASVASRTVKPMSNQSDEPDCCALLCQLRDYAYACHHQLTFLKAQCKRDKLSGGWMGCQYGSDVKTSSPLQAFLTDRWDSTFKTHLFDPCNPCLKIRVKMGFRMEDLPNDSPTGNTLSTILTPSCGGEDHDALLRTKW